MVLETVSLFKACRAVLKVLDGVPIYVPILDVLASNGVRFCNWESIHSVETTIRTLPTYLCQVRKMRPQNLAHAAAAN